MTELNSYFTDDVGATESDVGDLHRVALRGMTMDLQGLRRKYRKCEEGSHSSTISKEYDLLSEVLVMIVEKTNEELQNDEKSTPSWVVLMQTIIVRSNQATRYADPSTAKLVFPRSGYPTNRHIDPTMLTLECYRWWRNQFRLRVVFVHCQWDAFDRTRWEMTHCQMFSVWLALCHPKTDWTTLQSLSLAS